MTDSAKAVSKGKGMSPAPVHVHKFTGKIENRSHIFNVHTDAVNCIRLGDHDGFLKELKKDLLRINNHWPGGWYGGDNHLLHVACYFNQLRIITTLLDMGATLECRTAFNYTPLMVACVCGHWEIVIFLLSRGADVNLMDTNRRSCLDLCHSSIKAALLEELRPKTPPPEPEPVPVRIITEAERIADERRRIKIKFDEADADGSGELDATELAAFCESLGTKLSEEELEAALLILDESGDGCISYEEFAEWWLDE
jgi:hypothetical protein